MARNWIVLGDPTSSGGTVITASGETDIAGKGVARIGDKATCPSLHKGVFPIVDGDASIVVEGQPVALHGAALACGCKVLSSQQAQVFVDGGGGSGGGAGGVTDVVSAANTASKVMDLLPMLGALVPVAYDQAIRFVGKDDKPLGEVEYTLHLANGETVSGITDPDGVTERIPTDDSQKVVRAELKPPAQAQGCCGGAGLEAGDEPEVFELDAVITTSEDVGTSVQPVKASGHERGLTAGEIEMARLVYGDAVDYSKVKVHNHGYWMFFGLQNKDTAVTPNGEMYFPKGIYREDYSAGEISYQQFFIHEMAHVWQYQLGYNVKWVRAPRPNMTYDYELDETRKLHDYNMEAQGNIFADYFLAVFRGSSYMLNNRRYRSDPGIDSKLESVLSEFLKDRKSTSNLPRTTR